MRQLKAVAHFKPGEGKYHKEGLISNRKGFCTQQLTLYFKYFRGRLTLHKGFISIKTPTALNFIITKTSHASTISNKMKPHQESEPNTVLLIL